MDNDGKKNRALLSLQMLAAMAVCSFYYVAFENSGVASLHAQPYLTSFTDKYLPGYLDTVDNYIAAVNPAARFVFYPAQFRRVFALAAVLMLGLVFYRKWLNYGAMLTSLLHKLLLLKKIFKRAGPDWVFL